MEAVSYLPHGHLEYDMRLWEAETAAANNIPFDESWYNLSILAREQMVGVRMARQLIEALDQQEAVEEYGKY